MSKLRKFVVVAVDYDGADTMIRQFAATSKNHAINKMDRFLQRATDDYVITAVIDDTLTIHPVISPASD